MLVTTDVNRHEKCTSKVGASKLLVDSKYFLDQFEKLDKSNIQTSSSSSSAATSSDGTSNSSATAVTTMTKTIDPIQSKTALVSDVVVVVDY